MLKSFVLAIIVSIPSVAMAAEDRADYDNYSFEQKEEDLSIFEDYLNHMATLKGDFSQTTLNGTQKGPAYTGKLHLSRPWKMRLNYNPPSPLLLVADGKWLITYDKELDETNYVSLDNTPAEFILRPHIKFGGDVQVISVIPQADDTTAITLVKEGNYDEGQITLVFSTDPVSLKEWTVIDAQGGQTHVVLSNLKLNEPVSNSLFEFNKPNLAEKLF